MDALVRERESGSSGSEAHLALLTIVCDVNENEVRFHEIVRIL